MNNESEIYTLLNNLCRNGEYTDYGCSFEEITDYIEISKTINAYKSVCVVCDWQWWELNSIDLIGDCGKHQKQAACAIMANYVIDDQIGRFNQGDWVRSSLLTSFHKPCLFETKNTFYLLVGPGKRKTINHNQLNIHN